MAMPKTKINRTRARNRRATYYRKLQTPTVSTCQSCGAPKEAHKLCMDCGTFINAKGQSIQIFEAED